MSATAPPAISPEPILDPGRPIIDPHHHLWPGTLHYQDGPYRLDEIAADVASGHNIRATVYVDAYANYAETGPQELRPVGETAYANGVAEAAARRGLPTRICAGIVCNAELRLPNVAEVLDAHRAAAPQRLRGVRQIASWDPTLTEMFEARPQLYDEPAFRRGFAELAPRGLSFDACIYHFQLPQVASLARAFPDTLIILDHIGSPLGIGPYQGRRDEALAEWRGLIGEAAASPNVVVKLGGQGMWLAGVDWPRPPDSEAMAATFGDLFHRTIEAFGPERCMFESNFPVDRHTSSYATLWNMLKRIGAAYSEAERTAMFYGVADRVYRLGLP